MNIRWIDQVIDCPFLVGAFVECLAVLLLLTVSCNMTRGVLLVALAVLPDMIGDFFACRRGRGVGHGNHGSGNDDNHDNGDGYGEDGSSYDPV